MFNNIKNKENIKLQYHKTLEIHFSFPMNQNMVSIIFFLMFIQDVEFLNILFLEKFLRNIINFSHKII